MLFCEEAVDSDSEKPSGFLPVFFKVGRKHLENVCVAVDVASDLISYFVDEGESFVLGLNFVKLDIFNFLDDEVVYLYELVDDAGVLELQHNLYEFPQFEHVLRVVMVLVKELFQIVLARFLYLLHHVHLLLLPTSWEEEPSIEFHVLLLPFLLVLLRIFLIIIGFFVVDVLGFEGNECGPVLGPVLFDILDFDLLSLLLRRIFWFYHPAI